MDDPADQPNVTGVGGTSLRARCPPPPARPCGTTECGAGGGGISQDFVAPSWQQIPDAAAPSPTPVGRSRPSVPGGARCVGVVGPAQGDIVYFGGRWQQHRGNQRRRAAVGRPTAVANQGCAAQPAFSTPALRRRGRDVPARSTTSPVGNNNLFDQSSPTPATRRQPDYDLASGWGSPKGLQLLVLSHGLEWGLPFCTGLSPSSGPAVGGRPWSSGGADSVPGCPRSASVPCGHGYGPHPDLGDRGHSRCGFGTTLSVTVTTGGAAGGTSAVVPAGGIHLRLPSGDWVVPVVGRPSGGGLVTVSGSGLLRGHYGAIRGDPGHLRVHSPMSLVARVPAGPSGGATVDITVRARTGPARRASGDRYTYALPGYWLAASTAASSASVVPASTVPPATSP